jgi:3-oxoacyl-[acyl-carrier-protein] synthase I
MSVTVDIIQCGAVTAVGLTAPQTCAAIRAGISGFRRAYPLPPPQDALLGSPVPARKQLKRKPAEWLVNLAARAISECLTESAPAARIALMVNLPEANRKHPALTGTNAAEFAQKLQERLGTRFLGPVFTLQDGHAGALRLLEHARDLIIKGEVEQCVVGGVDSLLNEQDIVRLQKTYRIRGPENAHGVIPGEGAAFVLLSPRMRPVRSATRLLGVGVALEKDTVLSPRFSQGRGLQDALNLAVQDAAIEESTVTFRVSDLNGERYRAWESLLAATRFYRTRRERLPCWYLAAAVGDLGAAAGALALIVAAAAVSRDYAAGSIAMCEASSDEGLRAACLIGRTQAETSGPNTLGPLHP